MAEARVCEVTVHVHLSTERAIMVSDDGHEKNAVWLPLSQCEVERLKKDMATVTLPEWLAKEKGLI